MKREGCRQGDSKRALPVREESYLTTLPGVDGDNTMHFSSTLERDIDVEMVVAVEQKATPPSQLPHVLRGYGLLATLNLHPFLVLPSSGFDKAFTANLLSLSGHLLQYAWWAKKDAVVGISHANETYQALPTDSEGSFLEGS